ncbi:MAG TPA: chromate resistance protein ChrB domain-containing protein [Thermomicrobiaceae bacterium]|nr:chromate resistance protein ChrB domain-containing protein [Thermomicrobiaceae bacterium]
MKWVTRTGVRIDRVSSSWLIWTFIDPEAEILFVPTEEVVAVAEREGGIPFDVPGVAMGHHGNECAFDAILQKYGPMDDPALEKLAAVVRGADTRRPDLTPQSGGMDALAHGYKTLMQLAGYDNEESIRRQWHNYDALYLFFGGDPAKLREPI